MSPSLPSLPSPATLMLLLLLLARLAASSAVDAAEAAQCFERGDCWLRPVCGFALAADPQRCYGDGCRNVTGQLVELRNGLGATLANLTWRAWPAESGAEDEVHTGRLPTLGGREERFLSTGLPPGTDQVVEAHLGAHVLDSIVVPAAPPAPRCMRGEACAHLLRVCYGNAHDPDCSEYARHCDGFRSVADVRRNACVPDCLVAYYESDAPLEAVRSDAVVVLLDLLHHRLDSREAFEALLGGDAEGGAQLGGRAHVSVSANLSAAALLEPLQDAFCNVSYCDVLLAEHSIAGGAVGTLTGWLVALTLIATALSLVLIVALATRCRARTHGRL